MMSDDDAGVVEREGETGETAQRERERKEKKSEVFIKKCYVLRRKNSTECGCCCALDLGKDIQTSGGYSSMNVTS